MGIVIKIWYTRWWLRKRLNRELNRFIKCVKEFKEVKKLLIYLLVLFISIPAFGEVTFYNDNTPSFEWDASTTDIDGDPITGVMYRIYIVNADTDPDKTNPVVAAEGITALTYEIILDTKGRFFVGVSAYLDDQESVINWGDEAENQGDNELFGVRFAVPPHTPKNVKR